MTKELSIAINELAQAIQYDLATKADIHTFLLIADMLGLSQSPDYVQIQQLFQSS